MNFEIAPKETETYLHWEEAMLYCQFLDYDGGGWRLPTKEELNWMWRDRMGDRDYSLYFYWSSTEELGGSAWLQGLTSGYQDYHCKFKSYLVRAIRDKS